MRIARQISYQENGAAAVEFALLVPALTLLVLGIIQFGMVFNSYLQVTHAAREGVRWAALERTVGEVESFTIAAAPTLNPSLTAADIQVFLIEGGTESELTTGGATINDQSKPVKVMVSYAMPINVPIMQSFLGSTLTLVSSATQKVE